MPRLMRKLLVLCVVATSVAATAAKKNPGVEKDVKAQLVNKSFTTKILVGSNIPCPHPIRSDAIEPVDTELSPDGSIRYYARANCFFPGGIAFLVATGYIPSNFSGSAIQPGSVVWIRGVDFKENRIEVSVSINNNDNAQGYGKIKYMLGADYRDWQTEQVMEAIAQGIQIPAFERIAQLKREYETLCASLLEAERRYSLSKEIRASEPRQSGTEKNPMQQGVPLKIVKPNYPIIAKAAGIQGTVVLDVLVGKDGYVESATVVSGPPLLLRAAIDAVKQWTYLPSMVDGQPVEFKVEPKVKIDFTLGDTPNPTTENNTDQQGALADAIALRQVLEKLQSNRIEFIAMGRSDSQAGIYSEKLKALIPEISKLSEEDRKERVARVQDQLNAQYAQLSTVQQQVRLKPPSSLAEWQHRADILTSYSSLLDERQKLLDQLQADNQAPTPEDLKLISDDKAEIATDQSDLQTNHQQLEVSDLDSKYSQLSKKQAQLLNAYTRAFATPRESAALQELIAVLDQMVANREQVVGLGDKEATEQLTRCRAEADKFRRR